MQKEDKKRQFLLIFAKFGYFFKMSAKKWIKPLHGGAKSV